MPNSVLGTGDKIMNKRELSQALFSPQTAWWLSGNESDCSGGGAGDLGSVRGWGRSPGGGNGHPLQNSFLESPRDRGAWWTTVCDVPKSCTRLSMYRPVLSTTKHLILF